MPHGAYRRLRDAMAETSPTDLALALTLVSLLLQSVGDWRTRPLILLLAGGAAVFPAARRSSLLWWGLFALTGSRVLLAWPMSDNHAYLLAWWCLACALCLPIREREEALARSAQWLIGLTFLLAFVWKAGLSTDFTDQTFFRITLLLDTRFEGLVELAAGLEPAEIEALRDRLERHVDGPSPTVTPAPPSLSPRFLALAAGATVWTLAIEALVALAFLWPGPGGVARLRDASLLIFCATTYAIATIEGFAWLLLSMGLAQCPTRRPRTRSAYLAVFALILLYRELPWVDLIRPLLAP